MREFVSGAELIARAALTAGCDFFAGYPITPASGILAQMLTHLPDHRGIGLEGEDEIASMGLCLGAVSVGRKAMTATSGPGLSLYSENLGFAIMAELPLVVVIVQRQGPSTGGATTNAEGDIQFVRWGTAGGYVIPTLCPSDLADCHKLTIDAFNLAETLRSPVFLLTCKDLVSNRGTVDLDTLVTPRIVTRELCQTPGTLPYEYKDLADVPPFVPIGGDVLTRVNTSNHGHNGLLAKQPEVVDKALKHLAAKIDAHRKGMERLQTDLQDGAETCIVAFGPVAKTAKSVVRQAREKGRKLSLITIHSLWPMPREGLREAVGDHARIVVPELNQGQYVREVERLFPTKEVRSVTRIDGIQITPAMIEEACR